MRWLALESSCDETALAVWDTEKQRVLYESVLSQIDIHASYGGVVPGIAIREHLKVFPILLEELQRNFDLSTIDVLCVTHGPGLIGCLGMGVAYAQSLQFLLKCPLYGVNHLHGHALSPFIEAFEEDKNFTFEAVCPHLGLLVSGGNTLLFEMNVDDNVEGTAEKSSNECSEKDKPASESFNKNPRFSSEKATETSDNNTTPSDILNKDVTLKLGVDTRIFSSSDELPKSLYKTEAVVDNALSCNNPYKGGNFSSFGANSPSINAGFSKNTTRPSTSMLTFRILAQTVDDAAGEALDKGGKLLCFPYPGGPLVERCARGGDENFVQFPRAFSQTSELKFSFSGLKTSLRYFLEKLSAETIEKQKASICASYQAAVTDALVCKVRQVLRMKTFKSLGVSGGVSNNQLLRRQLQQTADREKIPLFMPKRKYCGDNAAMIAFAAPWVASAVQLNPNRTLDETV